jgi:hypothetical protein
MRLVALLLLTLFASSVRAAEPDAAANEFFESKVRPLLIDNCFSCHGEKKQEAGLRLDSREAILKGSDGGPVVVPGAPEKSRLVTAIGYGGSIKMPPKGKLPAEAVEALTAWVKLGVPFPGGASSKAPAVNPRSHWAYQPVRAVQPPAVKGAAANAIDQFILSKLEAKGLSFTRAADSRALVRRAYYDLIGLPPTPEEVDAFVRAATANPQAAYAQLVDRLLASPQYGEAQARHWLDLARYADTKGYVFMEDRNYPYAFTYRDWVVRALNADMPYDRFIQLQIAADRMQPADRRDLAAMGFLTLGRRFLNNTADIIDDRLDVVSRTFMGLTIGCARCHDHKFDPIPAKDYYSLYGVFASSIEPTELPLIGDVERTPEAIAYEAQLKKLEENKNALAHKLFEPYVQRLRKPESIAAYLLAVRDLQGKPNEKIQAYLREHELNQYAFNRWRNVFQEFFKKSAVFAPLQAVAAIDDKEFADKAPAALARLFAEKSKKMIDAQVVQALSDAKPKSYQELTAIFARLITSADARGELRAILGPGGPVDLPFADVEKVINRADLNKVRDLQKKIDVFKASPGAPPRAMVLADAPALYSPYVFLRGNPGNRGPAVPRQFLEILSGPERKPFKDGSGRLEMAKAIASPSNPLTARVMVNRLWIEHFGLGLVRTPSDFGMRSEAPTHPELLDWLSTQFVESGWSVKKMHRLIMLSRAYQQSAELATALAKLDPENRLISRMNRRRLDFEPMRDSLLQVAGQLDLAVGGKPVDLFKEPFSHRRTIYGFIDRQNLPGTFRIFDFASPDQHSPQRFTTTVPQQALFLMNSPFVMEQARQLAARPEVKGKEKPAERIAALVRLIYGRTATADEIALAQAFLNQADEKSAVAEASPWQYGCGAFDDSSKRVVGFKPLPHWSGLSWQGGSKMPDPQLGWVMLHAAGGHPGKTQAAVRRWVAPIGGEIVISGTLRHPNKDGDGVRGRIVSSRHGELGAWKVKNNQVEINLRTSVAKDDTIDFITDCLSNEAFDAFTWTAVIRQESKTKDLVWDSQRDFAGPVPAATVFGRWEQLTQVMLLSNEFAFVD